MVTVKQASTKKELTEFMQYPLELYKDNPYYVPDILSSQVEDMMPDKNPAFEYADAACWMAYRDGQPVGRIEAIHNRRANEKFGRNYVTVTNIDFIDDDEVVDALFDTAEAWGREHGCTHAHGPLGFSDMDREGMLTEGFDRKSLFITYYNHPYYIRQMERRGYGKEVEWIEFRITIPEKLPARLERIADYAVKKAKVHVVNLGDKPTRQLAEDLFKLWNETYRVLFGVVPMTEKQVQKYVSEFLPLIDKRTTTFVYNEKDEMVAFAISAPALDDAMRKNGGKLFPFGWIPFLRALKGKNDTLDLLLISVHPAMRASGLTAVIMKEMLYKVYAAGFRYAETGPMLESNEQVHAVFKDFEHEQHKRRRCWVKEL